MYNLWEQALRLHVTVWQFPLIGCSRILLKLKHCYWGSWLWQVVSTAFLYIRGSLVCVALFVNKANPRHNQTEERYWDRRLHVDFPLISFTSGILLACIWLFGTAPLKASRGERISAKGLSSLSIVGISVPESCFRDGASSRKSLLCTTTHLFFQGLL